MYRISVLPCERREVDDHVGPLGRREQERVLVDVADVEPCRVGDPRDGLVRNDHRGRQEATLGPDLDPTRPRRAEVRVRCREDVRVRLSGGDLARLQRDLGVVRRASASRRRPPRTTGGSRSGRWPRSGSGTGTTSGSPWSSGTPCPFTIGVSLNCSIPTEMFGVPGISFGSQNGSVWYCQVLGSFRSHAAVVVRVVDRPVRRDAGGQNHGPYIHRPNALMPGRIAGVLRRHVDVVVPEVALAAPPGGSPTSGPAERAARRLGTKVRSWMTSGAPRPRPVQGPAGADQGPCSTSSVSR